MCDRNQNEELGRACVLSRTSATDGIVRATDVNAVYDGKAFS